MENKNYISKSLGIMNGDFLGHILVLSNTPLTGRHYKDFDNYKEGSPFKHVWYNRSEEQSKILGLLKRVIPEKANQTDFIDVALDKDEVLTIKNVFEKEIEKLLIERKPADGGFIRNIFGNDVLIDVRKNGIIDKLLIGYNGIYEIAKECLDENKPIYLSID